MKKYICLLYPLLTCWLLAACSEDYLETQPTDAVSEQAVFTSLPNAWAALNGIHRAMFMQYNNQDEGGEGSVMINRDVLGEDVVMTGAGSSWFIPTYRWMAHRNAASSLNYFVWRFYYMLNGNANMIISNIDRVDGAEEQKKAIKGQALTYRAWTHFELVQLFAKRYDAAAKPNNQPGIPILTSTTTEPQPRASVEAVYEQINKDLDAAIALLGEPGVPARTAKSHFNVNVVKGLKARVALTMQDWETAAQLAAEARQGFSLMSPAQYLEGFNNVDNPEWMWGSRQIADQSTYFFSFFAYMSANFNSSSIRVNPKAINAALYHQIPPTDIRRQLWDPTGAGIPVPPGGARRPYSNKKFLAANASSSLGDVPYMRVAEMYLIEAEAKARLGQHGPAADVLHLLVQNRNPVLPRSQNTGPALIEEIMLQRRVELWGEGFRFLDLKRTNSALNRRGANHIESLAGLMFLPAGDVRWEFLIPQAEMNANSLMVQNPL